MNWLNKLLGFTRSQKKQDGDGSAGERPAPTNGQQHTSPFAGLEGIRFGRYSDNNKSQKKTQSWYLAEDRFKEKNYEAALQAFFDYLRDDEEDNVTVRQEGSEFKFTILQGSKKVHGEIKNGTITAKSPMAIMDVPGTAVMRRLLEMNYSLYYSHSGMDDNNALCMVFIGDVPTTNPSKLYYGLRELATKADRQDDLLLTDFPSLKPTDVDHIQELPAGELDVKYRYFRKWIGETLDRVSDLNPDSFSGAVAYLLLALIYRIDFLILPEARLLAELEKINSMYWDRKDELPLVERNQMMKDAIAKLLDLSKDDFAKSLYRSKSTFSIATPPKSEKVRDHIISANKDSGWYIENKYPDIALTINEYGMLYNQFIYSMPQLQTDLITIYAAVMHPEFFRDLGMKELFYDPVKKVLNKGAIMAAIDKALDKYKDKFRSMKWEHNRISYDDRYEFGLDFSEYMANLNLETKRD